MQGKTKLISLVIALAITVVAVLFMAGSFHSKQAAGTKALLSSDYKGKVVTLTNSDVTQTELVPGSVIAKQNTQISSRVMAQVSQFKVRAGDTVRQGDLLVALQQDDFKAQLAQSSAQINAIQASLTQAKKQLTRIDDLYKQGLVAVSDYDEAKAKFDNLTANLSVATQQQTQAQIALEFTRIEAPISGVVVERFVEPGDTAVPGTPLLALYNPQQLQLAFNVRERQAVKLKLGEQLTVSIPSLEITTTAVVTEIVPVADTAARSMLIRLDLPAEAGFMPGLYAQLHLSQAAQQAVLIDPSWVHQYGQLTMVYVLNNQHIERRYVRLGKQVDGLQQVVAGLSPGDQLAIEYSATL